MKNFLKKIYYNKVFRLIFHLLLGTVTTLSLNPLFYEGMFLPFKFFVVAVFSAVIGAIFEFVQKGIEKSKPDMNDVVTVVIGAIITLIFI
jgi:hypothetical protein